MPRNTSGVYSLPPGINPVISGTIIDENWANPTLADIAAALTDSLSRSGNGGMTAPFKVADGTEAQPGLAFTNESSSGFYRAGSGDIRFSLSGADVIRLNGGALSFWDEANDAWKIFESTIAAGDQEGLTSYWNNTTKRWVTSNTFTRGSATGNYGFNMNPYSGGGGADDGLSIKDNLFVGKADGSMGLNILNFIDASMWLTVGDIDDPFTPLSSLTVAAGILDFKALTRISAYLNDVEAVRINSDGEVGIGGAPAGARFFVSSSGKSGTENVVSLAGVFITQANGHILLPGLPTSASGLPSGALWRSGSSVAIVP